MIEAIILVSLSAATALVATLHSKSDHINNTPTRMGQTTIWGHAPAFTGLLLGALSQDTLFSEISASACAVIYAIGSRSFLGVCLHSFLFIHDFPSLFHSEARGPSPTHFGPKLFE
tara:strand:- start:341 stop:688 length:348 start_codon:yes stop_codon:yes gene_type:complete